MRHLGVCGLGRTVLDRLDLIDGEPGFIRLVGRPAGLHSGYDVILDDTADGLGKKLELLHVFHLASAHAFNHPFQRADEGVHALFDQFGGTKRLDNFADCCLRSVRATGQRNFHALQHLSGLDKRPPACLCRPAAPLNDDLPVMGSVNPYEKKIGGVTRLTSLALVLELLFSLDELDTVNP